jgi:hypothetical protein
MLGPATVWRGFFLAFQKPVGDAHKGQAAPSAQSPPAAFPLSKPQQPEQANAAPVGSHTTRIAPPTHGYAAMRANFREEPTAGLNQ